MRLPTYGELEDRLRVDLDLQDEDNFVKIDELAGYFNEAIDTAEAEIMALHEDYFLTKAAITFVQGAKAISLPTNIYAQKIREFIYMNGPRIYPIMRIRDPRKFYKAAQLDYYPAGEGEYAYMLQSDNAGQQDQIMLSPPAQESGQVAELWYIRNANRVPLTTEAGQSRSLQRATIIDIPEWADFLVQFAKVRCLEKEMDARLPMAVDALKDRKKTMVETLAKRTPDNDDTVPMDLDFYVEHN